MIRKEIMKGHHLILGDLTDFLTGETLQDTHDEQQKQKLARLLVEQKGYSKEEISPRCDLFIRTSEHKALVKVDFKITLDDRVGMIIKYGPGSLVTRQRLALAASRLLTSHMVPIVVVSNGEDADIMDGVSGKVIASGLDSVPSKTELAAHAEGFSFDPISEKRAKMESLIVYAFEIDGSCPCDDTVCRLE